MKIGYLMVLFSIVFIGLQFYVYSSDVFNGMDRMVENQGTIYVKNSLINQTNQLTLKNNSLLNQYSQIVVPGIIGETFDSKFKNIIPNSTGKVLGYGVLGNFLNSTFK